MINRDDYECLKTINVATVWEAGLPWGCGKAHDSFISFSQCFSVSKNAWEHTTFIAHPRFESEWLPWLIEHGFLRKKERTYRIGQRFEISGYGAENILVSCGEKEVVMVSSETGARITNHIKVGNCYAISESELKRAANGQKLTLLED